MNEIKNACLRETGACLHDVFLPAAKDKSTVTMLEDLFSILR